MLSVRKNELGFTLIEIMIALAIAGILLVSIYNLYISQSRTYTVQEQVSEMQQNARVAMDIILRNIRMAGYNPTGATFNGLPYNASQIQILADLNGDGDTADTDENIIYTLNTADSNHPKITRNSQPFAEDIEAFGFTYLDSEGNATTTNADIRGIRISITARTRNKDPDYTGDGYHRMTLTADVVARNL